MNEGGRAYDLASGTNTVVENYEDREDIFTQLGSESGKSFFTLLRTIGVPAGVFMQRISKKQQHREKS